MSITATNVNLVSLKIQGQEFLITREEAKSIRLALLGIEPGGKNASICVIVRDIVGARFLMEPDVFHMDCRREDIVWPRQIAMFILRSATGLTLAEIGRFFNKDHGTVIHAVEVVKGRMETSEKTKSDVLAMVEAAKMAVGDMKNKQKEITCKTKTQ